MTHSEMSDAQAMELLRLLDLYVGLPDHDGDTLELTVRMVVEDLLGSLSESIALPHIDL
jgi:hypothetical protein